MSFHKCLWLSLLCGIFSVIWARKLPHSNETTNEAIRQELISRGVSPRSLPIGRPINVTVSGHIQQILVDFNKPIPQLEINWYYRERWLDQRYEFLSLSPKSPRRSVMFGGGDLPMWQPDTFVPNAVDKRSNLEESFIKIYADGEVMHSVKQLLTIPCPMTWYRYPFDRQRCQVMLESYGYATPDITYLLSDRHFSQADTSFGSLEYQLLEVKPFVQTDILASGVYSRVVINVEMQRIHKHFGELFVVPMMLLLLSLFALKLSLQPAWISCILGFLLSVLLTLMVMIFNSFSPARYSFVVTRYWLMCAFQLFLEIILVFVACKITPEAQHVDAANPPRERDTLLHRTKLFVIGPSNETNRLMSVIFLISLVFLLFWLVLFWICVAPAQ